MGRISTFFGLLVVGIAVLALSRRERKARQRQRQQQQHGQHVYRANRLRRRRFRSMSSLGYYSSSTSGTSSSSSRSSSASDSGSESDTVLNAAFRYPGTAADRQRAREERRRGRRAEFQRQNPQSYAAQGSYADYLEQQALERERVRRRDVQPGDDHMNHVRQNYQDPQGRQANQTPAPVQRDAPPPYRERPASPAFSAATTLVGKR